MSVNIAENDAVPPGSGDEVDSPRKRMRLENSSRKGWSLMDRRTDQEVLQEMGVSLLEPDDGEPQCDTPSAGISSQIHKSLKRKHDIENVNPNVNSIISPRSKLSPRSPRPKCSPGPGPSRVRSPRSAEKYKPLQPTDQQALETTLLAEYLIDEETPLAQSVSAGYLGQAAGVDARRTYSQCDSVIEASPTAQCDASPRGQEFSAASTSSGKKRTKTNYTSLGVEEELILSRRSEGRVELEGEDSFSVVSDEVMLGVFRWLPKRSLAHCMLVCKRWHRVACDETLWQRLDLGNKALSKDALGRILARKPVIVRLASSELGEWHPPTLPPPSRIQFLDLSMVSTDELTLNNLLLCCPALKKLSLESVSLKESTCEIIGKCSNLETLNLTMAQGITANGLAAVLQGCTSLQSLNISWCNLSEEALEVLVSMLPQRLQRLNVGGARIMTDDMVVALVERCPRLVELDLSDCSRLGAAAVQAVLSLRRLEHLALSRCCLLPPHVLTKLSSMPALQYLEVWGMLQAASLNALRTALPAIQLNQFMFSAIARPTVGTRRTSIWGLRTRD